jgi:hypothetical protein
LFHKEQPHFRRSVKPLEETLSLMRMLRRQVKGFSKKPQKTSGEKAPSPGGFAAALSRMLFACRSP